MRGFLLTIFVAIFSVISLNASTSLSVGNVELIEGSVKVKSEGSFKKSKLTKGVEIKKGDLITTSKKARAVLKLLDGSTLILDASSTLHFTSLNGVEQQEGKIYYKITSRDAKNSLKVKTPFAIIGIKGTTFIVDSGEGASVKLKEGLIGIESIKEEFELYRKAVEKQFEDFMAEQQASFEEYKQVQKPGFVEITKAFDLQAGSTISFDGKKATESSWTKEDDAEFERFEKYMESVK